MPSSSLAQTCHRIPLSFVSIFFYWDIIYCPALAAPWWLRGKKKKRQPGTIKILTHCPALAHLSSPTSYYSSVPLCSLSKLDCSLALETHSNQGFSLGSTQKHWCFSSCSLHKEFHSQEVCKNMPIGTTPFILYCWVVCRCPMAKPVPWPSPKSMWKGDTQSRILSHGGTWCNNLPRQVLRHVTCSLSKPIGFSLRMRHTLKWVLQS